MKVLGLDLSLKATGYCLLSSDGIKTAMTTGVIPGRTSKDVKESLLNLTQIASRISRIVQEDRPDLVVIEAPAFNQKYQAAAIGELHGVVKFVLWSERHVIPVLEQATKMRSAVVGKISKSFKKTEKEDGKVIKSVDYGTVQGKRGKTKKATIKDVIEERLRERGLQFDTQDEMDAYVAAKYGWDALEKGSL